MLVVSFCFSISYIQIINLIFHIVLPIVDVDDTTPVAPSPTDGESLIISVSVVVIQDVLLIHAVR